MTEISCSDRFKNKPTGNKGQNSHATNDLCNNMSWCTFNCLCRDFCTSVETDGKLNKQQGEERRRVTKGDSYLQCGEQWFSHKKRKHDSPHAGRTGQTAIKRRTSSPPMPHFLFLFSMASWTISFLSALHWGYLPKNVPHLVMARHRRVARTSAVAAVKCVYMHTQIIHTISVDSRWLLPDQGQSAVKFLWLVCSIFAACLWVSVGVRKSFYSKFHACNLVIFSSTKYFHPDFMQQKIAFCFNSILIDTF